MGENNINHLSLKSLLGEKIQNNMQLESDLPAFMKNEDDSSCLKISNQPMERSDWFEDEICNYDKVRVYMEKLPSHEERGVEVITQLVDSLGEAWKSTFLDQEERVISKFLLSLQPEDLSQINLFDDDPILHREKAKMPSNETPCANFLLEEKRNEVGF